MSAIIVTQKFSKQRYAMKADPSLPVSEAPPNTRQPPQMTHLIYALALLLSSVCLATPPTSFPEAKVIAKQKIYFDQASNPMGELYCGCQWTWVGKSGGRIDAASCGYETRKQQNCAERTEWEHIVPA